MNRTALAMVDELSSTSTFSESDFVPPEMQIKSEGTSISDQEGKDSKDNALNRTDAYINGKGPTLVPSQRPFVSYRPSHRFKLLQKFEGTILRVIGDECLAHVRDNQDPNTVEEITFPLEELLENDRHLAVEGAVFNWYIGYEDIAGQRYRKSAMIFRRLPAWRKEDLEKAKEEAKSILEKLRQKLNDTTGKGSS